MRSTKEAWLAGPGDIKTADVEDVPVPGQSVRVQGLSARYSADVNSQLKLVQEGGSQTAKIDVATMEVLKFVHGVIEPEFTHDEAKLIQERFGPAWQKVITKIDELSGTDAEAVKATEARFPNGGVRADGTPGGNGLATGVRGSDVPAPTGA